MKNWIIAALVAALALSLAAGVVAQSQAQRTARVQLRLWENSGDPARNFVSVRTDGAGWSATTPRLHLDDGHSADGRLRYGDLLIETAVPDPVPTGLEISGLNCYSRQMNPFYTLHGWVRNVTDATISEVIVTAAFRDRAGVELQQGAAVLTHGISPWGERPFSVHFFGAIGVRGTCHVLAVEYAASVRFDAVPFAEAAR